MSRLTIRKLARGARMGVGVETGRAEPRKGLLRPHERPVDALEGSDA